MPLNNLSNQLKNLGIIRTRAIFQNTSYEDLYTYETLVTNTGYERAIDTITGATAINTGKYTGRSPKDKFIVETSESKNNIWWSRDGSDNNPICDNTWQFLKNLVLAQLNDSNIYVMDGFSGTNSRTQLSVRLITEVAWIAHFFKNMFIRPSANEFKNFIPGWTILHACKTRCENYQKLGLNSENFIVFNISERTTLIGGTWYSGEIKKGIFSMMNYFLPLQGVGSFHCSANVKKGSNKPVLFFGLSGTGKTTLSADPNRQLIGDDEHGWDHDGVFNLEGGCYAKTINLSKENEPAIYSAIRRNALLENVVVNNDKTINFQSNVKTENARVSYPIHHIENIVTPVSKSGHPEKIIFLTCDAYGVLPPISKLSIEQAIYQFLSGYTAKIGGTEFDSKEPTAVFSSCFGQPFLTLHPVKYAEILNRKMLQHGSSAYLINTGWIGGTCNEGGYRIPIKETRAIITAVLEGLVDNTDLYKDKIFGFDIPKSLDGVDTNILNPRNSWRNKISYDKKYAALAEMFTINFKKFTDSELGLKYQRYGPKQSL